MCLKELNVSVVQRSGRYVRMVRCAILYCWNEIDMCFDKFHFSLEWMRDYGTGMDLCSYLMCVCVMSRYLMFVEMMMP